MYLHSLSLSISHLNVIILYQIFVKIPQSIRKFHTQPRKLQVSDTQLFPYLNSTDNLCKDVIDHRCTILVTFCAPCQKVVMFLSHPRYRICALSTAHSLSFIFFPNVQLQQNSPSDKTSSQSSDRRHLHLHFSPSIDLCLKKQR